MTAQTMYTPDTLAKEWGCSAHSIRRLILAGRLKAFRVGRKGFRIRAEWVEDYVCQNLIASSDSKDSSRLSGEIAPASDTDTGLDAQTRLELRLLRQQFTPK